MLKHVGLAIGMIAVTGVGAAASNFEHVPPSGAPTEAGRAGKTWDAAVGVTVGYNDNVVLAPDETFFHGETGSGFVSAQGRARLNIYDEWSWRVDVGIEAGATAHFDEGGDPDGIRGATTDSLKDYNIQTISPSVTASRPIAFGSAPGRVSAGVAYRHEQATIKAVGLDSLSVRLGAEAQVMPGTVITAGVSASNDRFSVNFPDPDLDGRDGDRVSVEVSVRQRLAADGTTFVGGLRLIDVNADGDNFDYDGVALSARVDKPVPLIRGWVSVDGSVDFRNYNAFDGFATVGRTGQTIYSARLRVDRPVTERVSVNAFVQTKHYDSNSNQFSGDQTIVGAGFTVRV